MNRIRKAALLTISILLFGCGYSKENKLGPMPENLWTYGCDSSAGPKISYIDEFGNDVFINSLNGHFEIDATSKSIDVTMKVEGDWQFTFSELPLEVGEKLEAYYSTDKKSLRFFGLLKEKDNFTSSLELIDQNTKKTKCVAYITINFK